MDAWTPWIAAPRRWPALMAGVAALGALWIAASAAPAAGTTAGRVPSPREGFLAPDFTLDLLGGGEITLSDLRGRPVVLNLWASWCPPCRTEMPALDRLYADYQGQGLVVLGVNATSQDSLERASAFVQERGLTFPIALDRAGQAAGRYLLRALPTTLFIDREGVIVKVVIGGPMSAAALQSGVEAILAETR